MKDNLKTALDELYNEESAKYIIGDHVEFSPEFEKKMSKLLPKKKHKISIKKHAFKAVMIAAAAAALFGISLTAGAAVTKGFTVTEGFDKFWKMPTIKFSAAKSEDSPKSIEKFYTPMVLPENKNYSYTSYFDKDKNIFGGSYLSVTNELAERPFSFDRDLMFTQYTREAFSSSFHSPKYVEIGKTKVNGCPAYLITEEHYYGYCNTVIWDQGDYIFELWGNVSAEELIRIAESFEVNENALERNITPWLKQ